MSTAQQLHEELSARTAASAAGSEATSQEFQDLLATLQNALSAREDELAVAQSELQAARADATTQATEVKTLNEKLAYFTKKVEEMAELESKLREKIRSLKAQRVELLETHSQVTNAVSESAEHELRQQTQLVRKLQDQVQALEDRLTPPKRFEVLLRCSDGTQNWCLVR